MKNVALPLKIAGMFLLVCLSISCNKPAPESKKPKKIPTSVTDIDGNTYNVMRIENKLWMTENLRVTRYDTKSSCAKDTIFEATKNQAVDSQKPYFKDARNFKESPYTDNLTDEIRNSLGFLYNWCAATGAKKNNATVEDKVQGIFPNGWRLPTSADLDSLCYYLDGKEIAGKKLKSKYGWYVTSGTDESGMNCYPAGLAIKNDVAFVGKQTMFWSTKSLQTNNTKADALHLIFNQDNAEVKSINKEQANSVRCVLDLDKSFAGF